MSKPNQTAFNIHQVEVHAHRTYVTSVCQWFLASSIWR